MYKVDIHGCCFSETRLTKQEATRNVRRPWDLRPRSSNQYGVFNSNLPMSSAHNKIILCESVSREKTGFEFRQVFPL